MSHRVLIPCYEQHHRWLFQPPHGRLPDFVMPLQIYHSEVLKSSVMIIIRNSFKSLPVIIARTRQINRKHGHLRVGLSDSLPPSVPNWTSSASRHPHQAGTRAGAAQLESRGKKKPQQQQTVSVHCVGRQKVVSLDGWERWPVRPLPGY